jgi:hypothetical protein
MANEIAVSARLTIASGTLNYNSAPTTYQADMAGLKGPAPGAISVPLGFGVDVDFSQFTNYGLAPGWGTAQNLSTDTGNNYVDIGIYEPATGIFYPLLELLPGQILPLQLSRNLFEEFIGTITGTGTTATNNTLRVRAHGSSCDVVFNFFAK